MAENPALDPQGLPVPFVSEVMVLMRQGIEFHVDHLPSLGGGKWAAKGTLYMSSVRMVFVASRPTPAPSGAATPLHAFDMPLLYISGEKFNQPIFGCNNISGRVLPVQGSPEAAPSGPSVQLPHNFTIYFMEGGVGTFLPVFGNLLRGLRAANPAAASLAGAAGGASSSASREESSISPLPTSQPVQVLESVRSAYVDPKDPTVVYVEQPSSFSSTLRRRKNYQSSDTQE